MISLDPIEIALRGTQLVEASAGTGKTHNLSSLYLRILLEKELDVRDLLVVSYTKAATAELHRRIRARLQAAMETFRSEKDHDDSFLLALAKKRSEEDKRDVDLRTMELALHNFDEAAIHTLHGFCQTALHYNALECDLPFDLDFIADETELRNEVVHDYWIRELFAGKLPLLQEIESKNLKVETFQSLAQQVLPHATLSVAALRNSDVSESARLYFEFQERFLGYLRSEMSRRKRLFGYQGYDDLLQQLHAALHGRRGGMLANILRSRYQAALIDEFQDTDPTSIRNFSCDLPTRRTAAFPHWRP